MKLERFKVKDKKRVFVIVFTVCCILLLAGVFLYKTFALYTVISNKNIIEGTVQSNGDLYFAYYINDAISATMPAKNMGAFNY